MVIYGQRGQSALVTVKGPGVRAVTWRALLDRGTPQFYPGVDPLLFTGKG